LTLNNGSTESNEEQQMQVNRVATMVVETVRGDEPVRNVGERMLQSEVGFLPVMEHGKEVGLITDRDLALRVVSAGLDSNRVLTRDVMTKDVHWVYEDAELEDAVRVMADRAVRRLLVKDRQQYPVGVLSLDDIAVFTHGDETTGRILQQIAVKSNSLSAFRAL
jgi:predicted transcriptional regulator